MKYGLRFEFDKMIVDVLIEAGIIAFISLALGYWLYW